MRKLNYKPGEQCSTRRLLDSIRSCGALPVVLSYAGGVFPYCSEHSAYAQRGLSRGSLLPSLLTIRAFFRGAFVATPCWMNCALQHSCDRTVLKLRGAYLDVWRSIASCVNKASWNSLHSIVAKLLTPSTVSLLPWSVPIRRLALRTYANLRLSWRPLMIAPLTFESSNFNFHNISVTHK